MTVGVGLDTDDRAAGDLRLRGRCDLRERVSGEERLVTPLAPERLEAFYTQVQDFIDSIREKRPPTVTGEDGRAAIALIDAARRSSATGQAVQLQ